MRIEPTIYNSKVKRCQHIKADGIQCNVPALKQRTLCHFHINVQRQDKARFSAANPMRHVEDCASLRLALNEMLGRIAFGHVDHRDAALMIRTLRALLSTMRFEASIPFLVPDVVRDYSDLRKHVDWRNYMTDEEIEHMKQQGGRSINDILSKVARHLAAECNIPVPDDFAPAESEDESAHRFDDEPAAPTESAARDTTVVPSDAAESDTRAESPAPTDVIAGFQIRNENSEFRN